MLIDWQEAIEGLYLLEADADPVVSEWAFDELAGVLSGR
jgi:hypothetical protein